MTLRQSTASLSGAASEAPAEGPQRYDRGALDALRSTPAMRDALFEAVLIDDELDPDARLPDAIQLDFPVRDFAACFGLARALWYDGFDRAVLAELVGKLIRDRDLDAADRLRFKHIRAKFKHFRYAFALYGAAHRYPPVLDWVTTTMGHLQDGYRNGNHRIVLREALLLRLLLSAPATAVMRYDADRLTPTTPAAFRRLLLKDAAAMASIISVETVTGPEFHHMRKAIGRQVSFWDTLRTLAPTRDRFDMSRSLSAINGLMGDMHDVLIEHKAQDPASYAVAFRLPDDVRTRIASLADRFSGALTAA